MKVIDFREVASVKLFQLELSEDEVMACYHSIKYMYENLPERDVETVCKATKDELQGILDGISGLLKS